MKSKEISATINIELPITAPTDSCEAKQSIWQNVNATIDFYDGKIYCDLEASATEALLFSFPLGGDPSATIQSVEYLGSIYDAKGGANKIPLVSMSPVSLDGAIDKKRLISFSFLPTNGYISLEPKDEDQTYTLVFSGARQDEFNSDVEYNGQQFHLSSPRDSELLTIDSDAKIPEKILPLITLSFSLFQGAQIRLLEKHTPEEFLLYLQLPPSPGTQLCDDTQMFSHIWKWLAENDNFLSCSNWLEFFLAGTKTRGEYIDFRILNLFVSLNSRCVQMYGQQGAFGPKIAKFFGISEEDGHWIAYVRNRMVHEGEGITTAIDNAFADFYRKQKNFKVYRYAAYETAKNKSSVAFALYCDIIDLFMEHIIGEINYKKPIKKMIDIFGIAIK